MPEQTDKRRSWWGILTPNDRMNHMDADNHASQPDLMSAYEHSEFESKNRIFDSMNDADPPSMAPNGVDSESKMSVGTGTGASSLNGSSNEGGSLRRISSKMDLFKKSSGSKRQKTKGASKFATITTAWSSRSNLPGKSAMGSVSSTTIDMNNYEPLEDNNDGLIFNVAEQCELLDGERERDVAYSIRAEGLTKIILVTRRISDFLELDEKIRVQFPKARPALPLLDERRKSFLVSTRQFFFPRKNISEKLESYLRKVSSHEPLRNSAIFQQFLAVSQEGDYIHQKEPIRHSLIYTPYQESKSDASLGSSMDQASEKTDQLRVTPTSSANSASTSSENLQDESIVVRREMAKMRGNKVRPALPQVQERKKASIEDFQQIRVLGKGCMGKVMLVREIKTKKLFAMKSISKEWVILQREIEHTKSERNILANVARISHPFLIKLRHSFQSNAHLFMILDYYPGGDIATQLAQWHRFDPERCLFYAAEIVLGIEELHRQGIVYRDLKPENILLALDGHIVLTDFGLSKQFPTISDAAEDKTNTFCGTAEYLAPEILRAAEYSYAVDWWSLGTLLYEMIYGITPFWAENHAQMYQRVLQDDLEFTEGIDPAAADIICGLLERNPDYRLGARGAADVKAHPYFCLIDWDIAMQRKLPCPFVPDLVSEEDLSNFDDAFLTMTPRLTPGNHTLSNSIQNCFQGYSYTDKMASTLPRSDSKIHLVRSGDSTDGTYIEDFDQNRQEQPKEAMGNGHVPLHRSPLQQVDTQDVEMRSDSDSEEMDDGSQYRSPTYLFAPSTIITTNIETKAQATSPALTPPTSHPDDGRMSVERISITRIGAAADILRGYSERSSIDTRHNSTGSSHSSDTIGRRLSRGYV